jgi:hypothetical protein
MENSRNPSTFDVEDADYVTARLCANVDELDSAEWSFFTQFALAWISEQSIRQPDYFADSGMSLNDGPWMDCLYRTSVEDVTNSDIIRWMIPYHRRDDAVGAIVEAVRHTNTHPFPILQADANALDAIATYPNPEHSNRMVHYRITKMLIRLALMVRNIGQFRLDSPDYALFVRI